MRRPPEWLRVLLAALPFASLVFFPWTATLLAMTAAGLVFPPLTVIVGVLSDILYYPGSGLLSGTLWGLFLYVLTYAVRYIVRTRIM